MRAEAAEKGVSASAAAGRDRLGSRRLEREPDADVACGAAATAGSVVTHHPWTPPTKTRWWRR